MHLLDKQRVASVASMALVVVIVALVVWVMSVWKKHAQAEHAFAFVRDLAVFSETHGHLPASIQEFCQWKLDAKGRPVWDAEITARKVRFLWLSPDFSVSSNGHFLAVLDPSIKRYETALNEQIVGRISSNVLMRVLPASGEE